jgi:hypothetical protein
MNVETSLHNMLSFIDGHVKFAETKNAALLAVNAGSLFAIGQVLAGDKPTGWLFIYVGLLAAGNLLSAITLLLSFLPVTQIPWITRRKAWEAGGSLLFFGEAQRYDADTYLKELHRSIGQTEADPSGLEVMYANQIIANSKIAARKFFYFKVAMWLTLLGALTPVVGLILLAVTANRDL